MASRTVLITGSTGFIAGGIIRLLSAQGGYELFCTAENADKEPAKSIHDIPLDFLGAFNEDLLPPQVDHIIHLAQFPNHRLFPEKACEMFAVNTDSTLSLLSYGRKAGIKSFILASTGNVYDSELPDSTRREDEPLKQSDFYSLTKIVSEMLVSLYEQYFPCIIFRIFGCYGEGQQSRLIPSLIERIEKEQEVLIHGREGMRLNPIYIEDAAECFRRALLLTSSQVFNLAGSEILSLKQMACIIGEALNMEPRFSYRPDDHQRSLVGDIERLTITLGYSPRVSFREGVKRMITHLTANRGGC